MSDALHPIRAPPDSASAASPLSPPVASDNAATSGADSQQSYSPSPSDDVMSPPIPLGANYHTGHVDPRLSTSHPATRALHNTATCVVTPKPMPIMPRRYDDTVEDICTPKSAGTNGSPSLRGFRAASSPTSPQLGPSNGRTGCAPAVEAAAAAAAAAAFSSAYILNNSSSSTSSPSLSSTSSPSLSSVKNGPPGKTRFDHATAEGLDDGERESQETPEARHMFEKDENGVFQLATLPHAVGTAAIVRNRSKVNLASLNAPVGGGAGPRAPPIALVSTSLTGQGLGLARASSEQSTPSSRQEAFHPHGMEKLPYHRITVAYAPSAVTAELADIAMHVRKCLELRTKFVWTPLRSEKRYDIFENPVYTPPTAMADSLPPEDDKLHYTYVEGVFCSWRGEADRAAPGNELYEAPSRSAFSEAMASIMDFAGSGPVKTFCHNRLHILEARFNLHELLNHDLETMSQKSVPHRDFYNVRKIDNHVHHSAAMNQKHLLRFIKHKLKQCSDETVIVRDGKELTLQQVFHTLNITAYDLNVDTLDMHADKTFHRFDKFNLKYNPVGESRLREIFLKYNNRIKGKYLAELTQQVFDDLESNKYQFAEYRLSIYGREKREWGVLADWVVDNKLFSANVRWMIQIPRLYSIYKASGQLNNFAEMLDNIFEPLFAVTVDPASNPKLHMFLASCVGFDIVDDESLRERSYNDAMPQPEEWDFAYDPPYALFAYYMYANMCALNKLRSSRGFTHFAFRPHCGEAGDIEHLAAAFLLAKSINHGLMLQKSPPLQYLYYLAQIGLSMSPLSNNLLFLEYDKNPFPKFFKKGLNVTLSTDDPLMIHVTREPLVEEYSVAAQVWKLSAIDMSEIARNSVLQSGFEQRFKAHWIGNSYWKRGLQANDIRQTNVPDIRIQFRAELLGDEFRTLKHYSKLNFDESLVDRIM